MSLFPLCSLNSSIAVQLTSLVFEILAMIVSQCLFIYSCCSLDSLCLSKLIVTINYILFCLSNICDVELLI